MKKIAFTICSNNYLPQAKVLTDSIHKVSADYETYVVLCDKKHIQIDYTKINAFLIEARDLGIENFEWMVEHYNIVELNTALKPFAFKWFLTREADLVFYFDPDTCVYHSLDIIEQELSESNILLTPHCLAPLNIDGGIPDETTFTNYGIYNLGFCAVQKSTETDRMLDWWCGILRYNCWSITTLGLFVDQLPMNLAPLYFKGVKVTRHKGLNASWWNLHERKVIRRENGTYLIDNGEDLCFFHFSNYNLKKPLEFTGRGRYSRSKLSEDMSLFKLYADYKDALISAEQGLNSHVECALFRKTFKNRVRKYAKKLLTYIMFKCSVLYKEI